MIGRSPVLDRVGHKKVAYRSLNRHAPFTALTQRSLVMRRSKVVEAGLTDQILDDPQHPYSQLLVSSVLQP